MEADVKEFQYFMPGSLEEALALAARDGTNSALLAGGTDLIVQMKRGFKSPSCVINLKRIRDLNDIGYSSDKGLLIGPLVTHNVLSEHRILLEKYPLLAEAARTIGTFQIRERGTIGGNICNASPAADTIPPLICLGAKLKLRSLTGERTAGIEDFFEGPRKARLKPDEILTRIEIPILPSRAGGVYLKLGVRKALEIAVVGAAAVITLDNQTTCSGAKITLASVAPTPLLCPKAGAVLVGKKIGDKVVEEAAKVAREEAVPISDLRGTAEYRREMVFILTKRALNEAFRRITE